MHPYISDNQGNALPEIHKQSLWGLFLTNEMSLCICLLFIHTERALIHDRTHVTWVRSWINAHHGYDRGLPANQALCKSLYKHTSKPWNQICVVQLIMHG